MTAATPHAPGSGGNPRPSASFALPTYTARPNLAFILRVSFAPDCARPTAPFITAVTEELGPEAASSEQNGASASTMVRSPGRAGVWADSASSAREGASYQEAVGVSGTWEDSDVKKMARTRCVVIMDRRSQHRALACLVQGTHGHRWSRPYCLPIFLRSAASAQMD